jgi:NTE family protein
VRASIALPGLFTPVQHDGSWLVDGGLVNPVPVSLCRAMGADLVIAVDLNSGLLGRRPEPRPAAAKPAAPENTADSVMARIQESWSQLANNHHNGPKHPPMLDVLANSINIMQVLITRSRLAGEPADVMISPLLADLGLMEFHRGSNTIDAGRRAVEEAMPKLQARIQGKNGV